MTYIQPRSTSFSSTETREDGDPLIDWDAVDGFSHCSHFLCNGEEMEQTALFRLIASTWPHDSCQNTPTNGRQHIYAKSIVEYST
jgi:hypothetical protein